MSVMKIWKGESGGASNTVKAKRSRKDQNIFGEKSLQVRDTGLVYLN